MIRPEARRTSRLSALTDEIAGIPTARSFGRVAAIRGARVEIVGPLSKLRLGSRIELPGDEEDAVCEVVGFDKGRAVCLPITPLEGISIGADAIFGSDQSARIAPHDSWLGRVIDAQGRPTDGKGPLRAGPVHQPLRTPPPPAQSRGRLGERLTLGVAALDVFAACCRGQRLGIFAGSGVGKSVLLSMLARNAKADVIVLGLIGERGREVREFIEETLGADGLARSVVIVATSDEPALARRRASHMAMAIAEHFRDEGKDVLLLMDSLTRFAQAQREIGLACGEPPTAKGYTPSVFSELAQLVERAGPGPIGTGSITGLFSVLVDGDDMNEPVADAARGTLDGHIVMERAIAERGRYPAINVLKSVSRTMPGCIPAARWPDVQRAKAIMACFADMEEMIRIGAYKKGSSPEVDESIRLNPGFEALLAQSPDVATEPEAMFDALRALIQPVETSETNTKESAA